MDCETLVRTRICQPLKIDSTRIKLTPEMQARLAKGHNPALKPVANWDLPTFAGAGALRSTTKEMLKFVAANLGLSNSPLLTAMQKTHQPQHDMGTPDVEVGPGWIIKEVRN
ncbi:MAG: serine hydrolase [Acidobacteria bacterium]|nr:serine hydrolase [Acidobacteriota bacterium]